LSGAENTGIRIGICNRSGKFSVSVINFSADTWGNSGYFFGYGPGRTVNFADCSTVRHTRSSLGDSIPCRYAIGLPDTTGRVEPVHRELPIRQAHNDGLFSDIPVSDDSFVVSNPDHVLAEFVSFSGTWLKIFDLTGFGRSAQS
jgi:hypothetical protein